MVWAKGTRGWEATAPLRGHTNTHGKHNHSHCRDALYAKHRRQYARGSCICSDHHQATTAVAKRGGTVKVETLNIDGMKRNGRLGWASSSASRVSSAPGTGPRS